MIAKQGAANAGQHSMSLAQDPLDGIPEEIKESVPQPDSPLMSDPMDSLEGMESMDVEKAPQNETISQFENRLMAATIQQVEAIEVEHRILQVLMRNKNAPDEVTYKGIRLIRREKFDEIMEAQGKTVNDKLFPRGYGNDKLPEKVQ